MLTITTASGASSQGRLEAEHLADHPTAVRELQEAVAVGAKLGPLLVLERLEVRCHLPDGCSVSWCLTALNAACLTGSRQHCMYDVSRGKCGDHIMFGICLAPYLMQPELQSSWQLHEPAPAQR